MRARQSLLFFGALLAFGCADPLGPTSLDGTWTHDFGIPGSSLQFALVTNGSAISGNGRWTGEACCAGPVTVTGQTTGPDVDLDLAFTSDDGRVPAYVEHFTGRLVDRSTLSGTLLVAGVAVPAAYQFRKIR